MNVIVSHEGHEWKVLPESNDFTLNVFNSILEAKLHCNQSSYIIVKFECEKNCLTCKSNR